MSKNPILAVRDIFSIIGCSSCTGAIVSASLLAVALSLCVAVFTTVLIYLVRDKIDIKRKINIRSWRSPGRTVIARTSNYEDVRRDTAGQPKSTIDTKKNIAYGQAHTVSNTVSQ